MIEQDTIAREHAIRLAVVDNDPVRVELGTAIRRARVEWRGLALWSLGDLAIKLRRGRLVELDVFFETAGANGVEETKGAEPVDIACVFGHLKGDFDVRLGTKIVDLRGLDLGDDVDEVGAVA